MTKKRKRRKHRRHERTTQKRFGRLVDPAHKAMATKGLEKACRLSLKQCVFLVNHGRDGKKVKDWTMRRASLAIEQIIGKKVAKRRAIEQPSIDAENENIDHQMDDAIAAV